MSKLHKLRRAIQDNPTNWIGGWGVRQYARRAYTPRRGKPLSYMYTDSYRNFVRKVLHDLGYTDVK